MSEADERAGKENERKLFEESLRHQRREQLSRAQKHATSSANKELAEAIRFQKLIESHPAAKRHMAEGDQGNSIKLAQTGPDYNHEEVEKRKRIK